MTLKSNPDNNIDTVVYLLPSLGSDHRLYQNFQIDGVHPIIIEYPKVDMQEDIASYCKKIIKQIHHKNPILLGTSFCGILSQEISKIIPVKKVILVSTIKHHKERPFFFTFCRSLRAYDWISIPYFKKYIENRTRRAGLLETRESSRLYIEMLNDCDEDFLLWGFKQVCTWKCTHEKKNVVHIHGTADEVFAFNKINQDHQIENGDHMMIFNRPDELNALIENEIRKCVFQDS